MSRHTKCFMLALPEGKVALSFLLCRKAIVLEQNRFKSLVLKRMPSHLSSLMEKIHGSIHCCKRS